METLRLVLEFFRVLSWPLVTLAIALVFRIELTSLLRRLRHASLPGGTSLEFEERITEARRLSAKIETSDEPPKHPGPSLPLTEANTRMMKLGLRPSPSGLDMDYYRDLANRDPALALAGLRIELDILARNLAKGFEVHYGKFDSGLRLLRLLHQAGAITSDQLELARRVFQPCNSAVHGELVSREAARSVIEIADTLTSQYLAWLSWGFPDGGEPGQTNSLIEHSSNPT